MLATKLNRKAAGSLLRKLGNGTAVSFVLALTVSTLVCRGASAPRPQGQSAVTTAVASAASAPKTAGKSPERKVPTPSAADEKLPCLNEVAKVRELSARDAARGYPVVVKGVLTFYDPPHFKQFVQDETAGIYLDLKTLERGALPKAGEEVEVRGFSGPGDFAPVIHAKTVRILGEGSFPPAKPASLSFLMTGTQDSQWVALRGVVRSQSAGSNQTVLVLYTGEAAIKVTVPEPPSRDLVDAAVEVHGVCSTVFNERRRLQGVELQCPAWSQVEVTEVPVADPFKVPVQPIDDLFQFHSGNGGLHRARISGRVTLCQADGSIFVEDGTGGIHVQPMEGQPKVPLGGALEVVGFPGMGERMQALQQALVRRVEGRGSVAPALLDANTPIDENLAYRLVRLEGRLVEKSARPAHESLTIQFGYQLVELVLERGQGPPRLDWAAPGSWIRATGVCVARLDAGRKVQSFRVLLREPNDVVLIARPSWWTVRHTLWSVGALSGVLLLALAWVGMLRRQVQQRTRDLREEMEGRKQAQSDLLRTSRMAGMAEVATSVLHNVGNVLNSVNVSVSLIAEELQASRTSKVARVAEMLDGHAEDLAQFLTQDPKGRQLRLYLRELAERLAEERASLTKEVDSLRKNLDHIKDIVAMQQNYAKVAGVTETISVTDLVEDALRMHLGGLVRHEVEIVREYEPNLPPMVVDKHKVLQILVNLIHNAKYACEESGRKERRVTVQVAKPGEGRIRVCVRDNGVGIAPENLTRIFNHGFTTRKNGHGFALHSGALVAKELGGALMAESAGPGEGATFTLELPCKPAQPEQRS